MTTAPTHPRDQLHLYRTPVMLVLPDRSDTIPTPPRIGRLRWTTPTEFRRTIPVQTERPGGLGSTIRTASQTEPFLDVTLPRQRTATPPPRDATQAAGLLARALVEILAGKRDMMQLQDHCAPEVYCALMDFPMLPGGRAARLASLRTCETTDATAHVCAVVHTPGRARALSMRLEYLVGRWMITALEMA